MDFFPQQSPIISGSFAKTDLQLETSYVSLPLCICMSLYLQTSDKGRPSKKSNTSEIESIATHLRSLRQANQIEHALHSV